MEHKPRPHYHVAVKPNSFALPSHRGNRESPARDRLIQAVRSLLEKHHPSQLTTSMILKEAGVARNTLYLHFEDLSNLLETVLLSIFSKSVEENVQAAQSLVDGSKTKAELLGRMPELIADAQSDARQVNRFARCRLVAYSEANPRLAKLLAAGQTRLTAQFQKVFETIKEKSWLRDHVDPAAAGVLVQPMTLSKVIDDVSDKQLPWSVWNKMFSHVILRSLIKD